jgi:hypothetical protein
VTKGDVLDDLGFGAGCRAQVQGGSLPGIMRYAKKYSPKELQVIFAEPQSRVSELLNGKIANKSVDKLLGYAGRLGIVPKARFPQTNKYVVERELAAAAGA